MADFPSIMDEIKKSYPGARYAGEASDAPNDPADPAGDWKASRQRLDDLQKSLTTETPSRRRTWADEHPILSGLMSMIPGYQRGFELRSRMNLRAQELAQTHRENAIRDRMALEQMRMRGELSPQDYMRTWAQIQAMRSRQHQNDLVNAWHQEMAGIARGQAKSREDYNAWRMTHPGAGKPVAGKSGADPAIRLYGFLTQAYQRYLANPASALSGTPMTIDDFAKTNMPGLYDKLKKAGFLGVRPGGDTATATPDFVWNPDTGLEPYKGNK